MSEVDVTKPPFNKVAIVVLIFSLLSIIIWFIYYKFYWFYQKGDGVAILSFGVLLVAVLLDIIASLQIILKKQRGAVLVLLSVAIPIVFFFLLAFIG